MVLIIFAPPFRDVAQLVEYTSGGRVVAGSSPVIPTKIMNADLIDQHFL